MTHTEIALTRTYTKRLTSDFAGGPDSDGAWLVDSMQQDLNYCRKRAHAAVASHAKRTNSRIKIVGVMSRFLCRDGYPCVQVSINYFLAAKPFMRIVK